MTPAAALSDALLCPEALPWLLLAPASWAALALRNRFRARRLRAWIGARVHVLAPARTVRPWLVALGVILAVVAVLGPLGGEPVHGLRWQGVDVVVGLDVSRSMLAADETPSRLARAQRDLRALADRAAGDRLGLVLFAGEARMALPLTEDAAIFARLAEAADPYDLRVGGTDVGAALEAALDLLEGASGEHAAVVLATDGEDLGGRGLLVADLARERGIAVHAVGYGSALGAKIAVRGGDDEAPSYLRDRSGAEVVSTLDAASLSAIAERTGGAYREAAASPDPLVAVYEERILPMARRTFASKERLRRENHYQWPLLAAFACFGLALAWRKECAR